MELILFTSNTFILAAKKIYGNSAQLID